MKNIKQLVINNKKSYDDFNVYIASRNISSPKKKIIKESVPFSNIVYDFSKMNGELYWEERTLQYTFDIAEISTENMEIAKSKLLNWLLNVHDDDIYDPYIGDYHFHGSYDSDSWSEDFGAGTITVTFSVYPYKISNSDSNVIEEIGVSDGLIESNYSIAGLKIDGKSTQETRSGKNLCSMNVFDSMENNASSNTYDSSTHTITMDVDATFGSGRYERNDWGLMAGQKYTVSFDIKGTVGKKVSCGWDINRTAITLTNEYIRYSSTITATRTDEAIAFYSLSVNSGGLASGEYMQFDNVQIEKGSTSTKYEEYGLMPSPDFPSEIKSFEISKIISHTKQLLDVSQIASVSKGGVTVTNNGDGSLTIGGTGNLTENVESRYYVSHNDFIKLFKVGKLYLKNEKLTYPFVYVNLYKDGSFKETILTNTWSTNPNFELTQEHFEEDYSLYIGINGASGKTISTGTIKPMLYQDGDGTWEKYQYAEKPLELTLRSLPNGVCDTYKNGVVTRRVGVLTLDETSGVQKNSSDENNYLYFVRQNGHIGGSSGYCDKLTYKQVPELNTSNANELDDVGFSIAYSYQVIYFNIGYYLTENTIEKAKEWLGNNPLTIYYELATPTTETLELPTITTYSPVTVISFDSVLETTFEVYYNETKNITINNNSSHRITPTITSTGKFTITLNNQSYSIGEGTYTNTFYLAEGENKLTLQGYGKITFSYVEEVF